MAGPVLHASEDELTARLGSRQTEEAQETYYGNCPISRANQGWDAFTNSLFFCVEGLSRTIFPIAQKGNQPKDG